MANAPSTSTYILATADTGDLPFSRVITADPTAANLQFLDGGPGGTLSLVPTLRLASIVGMVGPGLMATDGSHTITPRTITSVSTLDVTNGNGLSGNPILEVINDTSVQKVGVRINGGSIVSTRSSLNFISGTNTSISAVDDSGENSIDITISASGGSGLPTNTSLAYLSSTVGNSFNLGTLTTGLLKISVAGGIATPSTAVANTDYVTPTTSLTELAALTPGIGTVIVSNASTWTALAAGTTGQVLSIDGSGHANWANAGGGAPVAATYLCQTSSNLPVDGINLGASGAKLAIGETAPTFNLDVIATVADSTNDHLIGINQVANVTGGLFGSRIEMTTYAGASFFSARAAGGTSTSPTAITNGNEIGGLGVSAWDGSIWGDAFSNPNGGLFFSASENFGVSNHGTQAFLSITPNATISPVVAMTIGNIGGANALVQFAKGFNFASGSAVDFTNATVTGLPSSSWSGGVVSSGHALEISLGGTFIADSGSTTTFNSNPTFTLGATFGAGTLAMQSGTTFAAQSGSAITIGSNSSGGVTTTVAGTSGAKSNINLDANSNLTVLGTTSLSGGGSLSGTFSGSHTLSGTVTIGATGSLAATTGATISGTWAGSPTFSGSPAFSSVPVFNDGATFQTTGTVQVLNGVTVAIGSASSGGINTNVYGTVGVPSVVTLDTHSNLVVGGTASLNGGGAWAGTFTGSPTLSGQITFSGGALFSGPNTFEMQNGTTLQLDHGSIVTIGSSVTGGIPVEISGTTASPTLFSFDAHSNVTIAGAFSTTGSAGSFTIASGTPVTINSAPVLVNGLYVANNSATSPLSISSAGVIQQNVGASPYSRLVTYQGTSGGGDAVEYFNSSGGTSNPTSCATLGFGQARGTSTSFSATQSGDYLGTLYFAGTNSTSTPLTQNSVLINATATETYVPTTNGGSNLIFKVTQNTTVSPAIAMTIGNVTTTAGGSANNNLLVQFAKGFNFAAGSTADFTNATVTGLSGGGSAFTTTITQTVTSGDSFTSVLNNSGTGLGGGTVVTSLTGTGTSGSYETLGLSRGTTGAYVAVQNNDILGRYNFAGNYSGTSGTPSASINMYNSSVINAQATETWTSGAHGSEINIYTTPNGTTALNSNPAARFGQDNSTHLYGNVVINSPVDTGLIINVTTGSTTPFFTITQDGSFNNSQAYQNITAYGGNISGAYNLQVNAGRGSPSSQQPLQLNDPIVEINATGNIGGGFASAGAQIIMAADQNYSSGNAGTRISFVTSPNGTTSASSYMTFTNAGYLILNNGTTVVSGTDRLQINGSTGYNNVSVTTWDITSDSRIKQNIVPTEEALPLINALNPCKYQYTQEYIDHHTTDDKAYPHTTDDVHYGFIAQEVEDIIPGCVKQTDSNVGSVTNVKHFNMHNMNVLAIKAIQELSFEIEALKSEIDALKTKMTGA